MNRPLVVAEIGLNHNGMVWIAKTMVSMAASLGVDFVKFQKRTVDACYKDTYLKQRRISKWGSLVRDEKAGLELDAKAYEILARHCEIEHVGWFASPYTPQDVEFLRQYQLPFLKIASQCASSVELLRAIKATGTPVVASTGACTEKEVANLVTFFGDQLAYLLHCTLTYPTADRDVNLRAIPTLMAAYPQVRIGFSSHSEKIIYPVAASVLGAQMIEFHITLDRNWDGPDHASSIGPVGFERIMAHLKSLEDGYGNGAIVPHAGALQKASNYSWR